MIVFKLFFMRRNSHPIELQIGNQINKLISKVYLNQFGDIYPILSKKNNFVNFDTSSNEEYI